MPLYELTPDSIQPVRTVRFAEVGIREREGLQRLLREKIDAICPDTLVVAEEFCEWDDSRRRIDLLGVDSDANLVVIELKRTEDGGHMELQAIRYAAMISALTFERVVEIFSSYLQQREVEGDARTLLLDHLGWTTSDEGEFAPNVRIVLASANFGKEITTAVLWLNDQGLDIRCVRLVPYQHGERFFVDIQQVIPLPEASQYTVQVRAKRHETRQRQEQQRDLTKFMVTLGDEIRGPLNKRRSILEVVRFLVSQGLPPEQISNALPAKIRARRFLKLNGHVDAKSVRPAFDALPPGGRWSDLNRYFHEPDELLHHDGGTWLLTKMWGAFTEESLEAIRQAFPEYSIAFEPADE